MYYICIYAFIVSIIELWITILWGLTSIQHLDIWGSSIVLPTIVSGYMDHILAQMLMDVELLCIFILNFVVP